MQTSATKRQQEPEERMTIAILRQGRSSERAKDCHIRALIFTSSSSPACATAAAHACVANAEWTDVARSPN
jgi:hypothetical protein